MRKISATERAFYRRFAIYLLLQKSPHTCQEIIVALESKNLFDDDVQPPSHTKQRKRIFQIRRDILTLRRIFDISCSRKNQKYTLVEPSPMLSLDETQVTALATILHTFRDKTLPQAQNIEALCTSLMKLLPESQQHMVLEKRRSFHIELPERINYSKLDPADLNEIDKAILHKRPVIFDYCSPKTGKQVCHTIEPQPLKLKDGHTYLSGWSLDYECELTFRLDYILSGSVRKHNNEVSRPRPSPRSYVLRYHLTPIIARNQVSQRFPDQCVVMHDDGSATITASITDIFEARQILLKYGENCIVDSPPELVKQFRKVADHYNKTYGTREK